MFALLSSDAISAALPWSHAVSGTDIGCATQYLTNQKPKPKVQSNPPFICLVPSLCFLPSVLSSLPPSLFTNPHPTLPLPSTRSLQPCQIKCNLAPRSYQVCANRGLLALTDARCAVHTGGREGKKQVKSRSQHTPCQYRTSHTTRVGRYRSLRHAPTRGGLLPLRYARTGHRVEHG